MPPALGRTGPQPARRSPLRHRLTTLKRPADLPQREGGSSCRSSRRAAVARPVRTGPRESHREQRRGHPTRRRRPRPASRAHDERRAPHTEPSSAAYFPTARQEIEPQVPRVLNDRETPLAKHTVPGALEREQGRSARSRIEPTASPETAVQTQRAAVSARLDSGLPAAAVGRHRESLERSRMPLRFQRPSARKQVSPRPGITLATSPDIKQQGG
jgi:hypothetical protein